MKSPPHVSAHVSLGLHIYRETESLMGNEASIVGSCATEDGARKVWFEMWWQLMGEVIFLTSCVCFESLVNDN